MSKINIITRIFKIAKNNPFFEGGMHFYFFCFFFKKKFSKKKKNFQKKKNKNKKKIKSTDFRDYETILVIIIYNSMIAP